MATSNFIEFHKAGYLSKMAQLSGYVNGSKKPLRYIFKERLTPAFSATDQWEVMSLKMNRVAADYVALDAQEPLKVRSSFGKYSGDLPKLGMSLILKESEMKRVRHLTNQANLIRQNAALQSDPAQAAEMKAQADQIVGQIVRIIYNDAQQCTIGVWEQNEDTFLRLLSKGEATIADEAKPGYGLELKLDIAADHKISVGTSWGDGKVAATTKAAKTVSTLRANIELARETGNVEAMVIDKSTLDIIAASDEGKQLYMQVKNQLYSNLSSVPTVLPNPMAEALATYLDLEEVIVIPKRGIKYEINGKQKTVYPYTPGMIVLAPSTKLGTLWYGTVEESQNMEEGVSYTTVDNYTLVSIKRTGDPLMEKTRSQAVVVPMLDNVDQMYWINTRP